MKDYLKSFHDSLQGQKVNTYVKLGFCCDEEIRLELRRQLIRMLNRHSQIFIMMLTVQLPEAYVDATERDYMPRHTGPKHVTLTLLLT